jgi:hypothetical protein
LHFPPNSGVLAVFKNSAEQGKLDLNPVVFLKKNRQKSAKIGKIRLKRTGDDGGTVKTGNTEMRLVSPKCGRFFLKTGVVSSERFLLKTGQFLPKFGKWNEKTVKNNDMIFTKFVHINSQ